MKELNSKLSLVSSTPDPICYAIYGVLLIFDYGDTLNKLTVLVVNSTLSRLFLDFYF